MFSTIDGEFETTRVFSSEIIQRFYKSMTEPTFINHLILEKIRSITNINIFFI